MMRRLVSLTRARRKLLPFSSLPIFQNIEFSPKIPCEFHSRNPISNTDRLYFSSISASSNLGHSINAKDDRDFSLYSFKNLFAYNPECISIDENGERIFISDSYDNRVIITNTEGKILDCIGDSSQGFEDGEFEFAKLSYPASSYYFPNTNSLYFIDSENNAIRKADMEKRLVETIYPPCTKKRVSIWKWIFDKIGFGNEKNYVKSQDSENEYNISEIESPYHLINIKNDNNDDDNLLLVIDKKFEISWIIEIENGSIREIIKGRANIMELCENIIKERVSLLKDIYKNSNLNMENYENALEHISSISSFENHAMFCEPDGKRILKYNLDSKSISCLQISNFGVLGLPCRCICPLERVIITSNLIQRGKEHIHSVKVLPGRCDIRVFIAVPVGTKMASPLEENSIFRQIRGSASKICLFENKTTDQEKVGAAQQWFDELDNLAYTQDDDESLNIKEENDSIISDINNNNIDENNKMYFDCALNISPGTCEVVVSAAIYLTIEKGYNNQEMKSNIIRVLESEIPNDELRRISNDEFEESMKDLVFLKPLRLRIKIECDDHPKSEKVHELISTESSLSLNIDL